MKEELDKKLTEAFPLLYRDRHGDPGKTAMCWGFPSDGWYDILWELSSKLEPLIEAQPEKERARASQVKEKFGGLRFYMDGSTRAMEELIDEAETKAWRTCEYCGKPGSWDYKYCRPYVWIKTLCEECHEERDKVLKERHNDE